mgnify:CR=1 FL=1
MNRTYVEASHKTVKGSGKKVGKILVYYLEENDAQSGRVYSKQDEREEINENLDDTRRGR